MSNFQTALANLSVQPMPDALNLYSTYRLYSHYPYTQIVLVSGSGCKDWDHTCDTSDRGISVVSGVSFML